MTSLPKLNCDLLVVGSGAAGLAAAITASSMGLKVIVAEKAQEIGGTTAWSGGWIWAPCSAVAKRHGFNEVKSAPREYLAAVQGNNFNPMLVDAFLDAAPKMIELLEAHGFEFECGAVIPDTYGDMPSAGQGGRSVIAAPFDGRKLGPEIARLRRPLPETTFKGMTIQSGPDLRAFMTMLRSPQSFGHVTKRVLRHFRDLAVYGRGMDLRNGLSLSARLMHIALTNGVELRTGHAVQNLIGRDGAIVGAEVSCDKGKLTIEAKHGVVLASGGYPHDTQRRQATFPRASTHLPLAIKGATGDGLKMGEAVGGYQATNLAANGAWCPVSEVTWPDGSKGTFPHIIDRGKPGVIGVLKTGNRFCNEGLGYHDYVSAMFNAIPADEAMESWLICDHNFLRRYGLGIVRPAPVPYGSWIRSGYLRKSSTIKELAEECGLDATNLDATITQYNRDAKLGIDSAFGRGTTPYMRLQGDPKVLPNPCMAPIKAPPFYAVKVIPGSFGTFAGLQTNGQAQVLAHDGTPIKGLYAAGTDMASVMGGHYPAGGINLGPALTFGFIAGKDAAETSK